MCKCHPKTSGPTYGVRLTAKNYADYNLMWNYLIFDGINIREEKPKDLVIEVTSMGFFKRRKYRKLGYNVYSWTTNTGIK